MQNNFSASKRIHHSGKIRIVFIRGVLIMTVNIMSDDKIKVLLSPEDMQVLGMTYEELDYEMEDTKTAINDILDQVRELWGFESLGYKLFVEVFKSDEGGCVFYFTRVRSGGNIGKVYRKQHKSAPKSIVPVTLKFDSLNDLCDYCRFMSSHNDCPILQSSLYIMDSVYYIVVFIFKLQYNKLVLTSNEFSVSIYSGDLTYAHLCEHGKSLISGDAIERMISV